MAITKSQADFPAPDQALVQIPDVLLETYAVNDAMNQHLLAHLDPQA